MKPEKKNDTEKWLSVAPPEKILSTVIGDVVSERFRCLRTGAEGDFVSLNLKNWVIVIAVTPDGEIVLIRQYRHGDHAFQWEFPGGCIDATDRDPVAAGVRELLEETGYAGEEPEIIGAACPNPAIQSNRCYTVLVRNAEQLYEPRPEETEDIEIYTVKPEEILQMILTGEMYHGIMLEGFFYYLLRCKL